jgi:hypothetical protein
MVEQKPPNKERRGRFKPGQSGNPAGKAKGTRNAATLALEALLDGQAQALTQKAIGLALDGDLQALRICLDRILPPRKDRPVTFEMAPITSIEGAQASMVSLLTAVSEGNLTPSEASEIGKLIDVYVEATRASEVLDRLKRLEDHLLQGSHHEH